MASLALHRSGTAGVGVQSQGKGSGGRKVEGPACNQGPYSGGIREQASSLQMVLLLFPKPSEVSEECHAGGGCLRIRRRKLTGAFYNFSFDLNSQKRLWSCSSPCT